MNHKIIPIFIPHIGCPHDCVFCNQRKITNFKEQVDHDRIKKYILQYLTYFKDQHAQKEIAFYGGSFTGIPREVMIEYLEIADKFIKDGLVSSIRCSTRPDYIDEEILTVLKKYHVKTIELGVQSMDDFILQANGRNHSSNDVVRASALIKANEFTLGLQMMTNLYQATREDDIETCHKIIRLKPDFVRIYPTLVIKDTELEKLYFQGKYHARTVEEEVDSLIYFVKAFQKAKIPIIRIGLQATDNINIGKDVVAGPFHASLRQLVEEKIYRQAVENCVANQSVDQLEIYAPKEIINYFIGNKAANKDYFIKKYGLKKVTFKNHSKILIYINDRCYSINPYFA